MGLNTHGRWPLVGAAGVIPVTVAAAERPELRPLAALLWHQTEEWVWPGSFLPWINREVLGSDEDEFPIDRRLGFLINVVFGWGFSVAAGAKAVEPAALLYVTHIGNAGLHVSWAIRHRRYDPGTVSALLTLLPVAVDGLRRLGADPEVPRNALRRGIAGGIVASLALSPARRRRAARRSD